MSTEAVVPPGSGQLSISESFIFLTDFLKIKLEILD